MPATHPFAALHSLSKSQYPDLETAVQRLADDPGQSQSLSKHDVFVQLEGISELSDALIKRIAEDLGEIQAVEDIRKHLTMPVSKEQRNHNSALESLSALAKAGFALRRPQ